MAIDSKITNQNLNRPAASTSLAANKTNYNSNMTVAFKNSAQPSKAQEAAVDTAGKTALSDYRKQAGTAQGRELLTKAMTGRSPAQLSSEQNASVAKYLDTVASGKLVQPQFEAASNGNEKDIEQGNKALGNEILPQDVDGAYAAGRNTALVSKDLMNADGSARSENFTKVVREETGEALAAAAGNAGVKIGEGDAGNRLQLALEGKDTTHEQYKSLNETSTNDTTKVRIGNSTVEAAAAGRQTGIWFASQYFTQDTKIYFKNNGQNIVAQNQGRNDNDPDARTVGTTLKLGYNGNVTIVTGDGKSPGQIVKVKLEYWGTKKEKVSSLTSGWVAGSSGGVLRVGKPDDKTDQQKAVQFAANSFGDFLTSFSANSPVPPPPGVSKKFIVENFFDQLNKASINFSNPVSGFPAKILALNNAVKAYAEFGASPEEIKKALDIGVGSTGANANKDFKTVMTDNLESLSEGMTKSVRDFKEKIKNQKSLDEAVIKAQMMSNILTGAAIGFSAIGGGLAMISALTAKSIEALKVGKEIFTFAAAGSATGSIGMFNENLRTIKSISAPLDKAKKVLDDSGDKQMDQTTGALKNYINTIHGAFVDTIKESKPKFINWPVSKSDSDIIYLTLQAEGLDVSPKELQNSRDKILIKSIETVKGPVTYNGTRDVKVIKYWRAP